jgi:hypothetical protein
MKIVLVESQRIDSPKGRFDPEFVSTLVDDGFDVAVVSGNISATISDVLSHIRLLEPSKRIAKSRYLFRVWRILQLAMIRGDVFDVRCTTFGWESLVIRLLHPSAVIIRRSQKAFFSKIAHCDATICNDSEEEFSTKSFKKAIGGKHIVYIGDGKTFSVSKEEEQSVASRHHLNAGKYIAMPLEGVSMRVFYAAFRAFERALQTNRIPSNTVFAVLVGKRFPSEMLRELRMIAFTQPLLSIVEEKDVSEREVLISASHAVLCGGEKRWRLAYAAVGCEIPAIVFDEDASEDLEKVVFLCKKSERSISDALSYVFNAPKTLIEKRLREGSRRMRRRFGWKRSVKKTEEVYKEAITCRRLRSAALKSSESHRLRRYAG